MMTTETHARPSANTIIGARAMIGMVWLAMTYGTNARSSSREWTKTVARHEAESGAQHEPDARLAPRVERRAEQVLGEALVSRCAGTAGRSASTMFQTWGRLRSFANGPAERRVPEQRRARARRRSGATGRRRGT